ncbi:heparinase II/III family protein [Bizionia sp. KMM 8389]
MKAPLKSELKQATQAELAAYFRTKFSERYFYDWKTNEKRVETYFETYPELKNYHTNRAEDHLTKYQADAKWKLPFNYQNGKPVNAYALRHLARQHKMVDIGYYYFYTGKDVQYLDYFTQQLSSLNQALESNTYETIKDGNGIYEAFRSGYRVLNWLQLHNLFLGETEYSDEEQLTTIATLLQHAQHLYEHNSEFKSGNHQTRGLSALAMIAIVLQDFEGANVWYSHAMKLLEAHLSKEINADGFQFERSVHYHMSDIGNYFYVYQLAKKSNLQISTYWESQLKNMFSTLVKIAYPNKTAPVLSDDTDQPWAEYNIISNAITLGYVMFNNPEMGYFANSHIDAKMFWYLSSEQLNMLTDINQKKPEYQSLHFPETGYYIMRNGWDKKDHMLVISAGLDSLKPDHQHGDMLGIQGMANGQVILPNYQVRYSLEDYEWFKNSMVKNVALVDQELQGKQYTSNKGGSGFGKFKKLPKPETILWETSENFDIFVGTHDGFNNIDVAYTRQVIDSKDGFWIVKDNFKSNQEHTYKQIWQGHYTTENEPNLLRASFNDGSGLDIYQLQDVSKVESSGARGKSWHTVSSELVSNYSFITIVYPFETFDKRINNQLDSKIFRGWKQLDTAFNSENNPASHILYKNNTYYVFEAKNLKIGQHHLTFNKETDLYISIENGQIHLQSLTDKAVVLESYNNKKIKTTLEPGDSYDCHIEN